MVIVNNKKISIRNENNITKIKDNLILTKSKSDIFLFNNRQIKNLKDDKRKKSIKFSKKFNNRQIQNLKDDKRKKSIKFSKKLKLDNYELNNLEYDKAIIFDKRKLIDIYWSLLRREHLVLSTFCNGNDYNIKYIKFARLIFLICTDMALNVFFFADETMHKMFLDYGKYDFIHIQL